MYGPWNHDAKYLQLCNILPTNRYNIKLNSQFDMETSKVVDQCYECVSAFDTHGTK